MLTIAELDKLPKHEIFMSGTANDDPDGLFMANTKKQLRWVAVTGEIGDWCIYCHFADKNEEWIKRRGDKVCMENHIRKLVPCDDEAFKRYRY